MATFLNIFVLGKLDPDPIKKTDSGSETRKKGQLTTTKISENMVSALTNYTRVADPDPGIPDSVFAKSLGPYLITF